MKDTLKYRRDTAQDNAKAIASGDLQVLVDFLTDLISHVPLNEKEGYKLLRELAAAGNYYGGALAVHLESKVTGRPRKSVTMTDATRAVWQGVPMIAKERKKGKTLKEAQAIVSKKLGIPRKLLRQAVSGDLPDLDPF